MGAIGTIGAGWNEGPLVVEVIVTYCYNVVVVGSTVCVCVLVVPKRCLLAASVACLRMDGRTAK